MTVAPLHDDQHGPPFVCEQVRAHVRHLPCRWRNPGKLRPSYDVGVFPQMRANQGTGVRALLSRESGPEGRSIRRADPRRRRDARVWRQARRWC